MVTRIQNWRRHDVDMAGVALLVLVALLGYALTVHGPLRDSLRYDQARRQRDEATAGLASMRTRCASVKDQIKEYENRLQHMESSLPDPRTANGPLSRLQDLASRCGVVLTRLQPMTTTKNPGYQASLFQIAGHGSFPAIQRWLARIESDVPYLDVTHFQIRASGEKNRAGQTMCLFECTPRLYLSNPEVGPTTQVKRP